MSYIRWLKISEALSRLGHQVDIATNEPRWFVKRTPLCMGPKLRRISLRGVRWEDYDVVKTFADKGFEALEHYGGAGHSFIISKLGSVVAPQDMAGIYFYGERRRHLYAVQERIQQRSRYVTVLSEPARQLWADCFGSSDNVLLVPGAADRSIPPPGPDPYPRDGKLRCVFAGTIYNQRSQPEANRTLIGKLNDLGKRISVHGARLYMFGIGDVSRLDRQYVTYLGWMPYERTWDYFYHGHVGVVVSAGPFMHNNESSKIYHYLRAGLPVVSESGFPNDYLVPESRCGAITPSGDAETLAASVLDVTRAAWNRDYARQYIMENHTWDNRAAVYDKLLRTTCASPSSSA
jgi:glycosyltransferase involved in cell wall biosynthesis